MVKEDVSLVVTQDLNLMAIKVVRLMISIDLALKVTKDLVITT